MASECSIEYPQTHPRGLHSLREPLELAGGGDSPEYAARPAGAEGFAPIPETLGLGAAEEEDGDEPDEGTAATAVNVAPGGPPFAPLSNVAPVGVLGDEDGSPGLYISAFRGGPIPACGVALCLEDFFLRHLFRVPVPDAPMSSRIDSRNACAASSSSSCIIFSRLASDMPCCVTKGRRTVSRALSSSS